MNRLYDGFVDSIVDAWVLAPWSVSLHGAGAVFDAVDVALGDVGDQLGSTASLSVARDGDGWVQVAPVVVSGVPSADVVSAVVVSSGGSVVAWFGRGGDHQPISLATTGEGVVVFGLGLRLSRPG